MEIHVKGHYRRNYMAINEPSLQFVASCVACWVKAAEQQVKRTEHLKYPWKSKSQQKADKDMAKSEYAQKHNEYFGQENLLKLSRVIFTTLANINEKMNIDILNVH